MSEPAVDLSSLSADQQSALQQYTSVTDQDVAAAVSLLQRCEWNVQIAITRFFDGDTDFVDVAAEAARAPPAERRVENIQDSFDAQTFGTRRRGFEAAPRVVPTPESQINQRLPFLVNLVFLPFNISYNIFSRLFSTIGWIFPFLPRLLSRVLPGQSLHSSRYSNRKPLTPRDTAARFIREFEEDYGAGGDTLPFQELGYAQAFDIAKKELKFMIVLLLSPEHDDTAPFVRDTLLSPDFTTFLLNHKDEVILWAGSVQDSEAYQVSNALNVTKFPFIGMLVHTPTVSSTAMSIVARVPGPTPASELINQLQKAMTARATELAQARATRAERNAAASIREEQNSAYERSLATDRERARQRREAEAQREREDRERREREEAQATQARNLATWKRWRASTIAPEPAADAKGVTRISLRMPSGERVIRRFDGNLEIEELYAFVECHEELGAETSEAPVSFPPQDFEHRYAFQLVSPMPREVYPVEAGGTIAAKIGRSGNLIVEMTTLHEDVDEDDTDLDTSAA